MESVNEHSQSALAKLSLGAEGIDKLLPPIYLEGGTKTQVWIPDVYKEVAKEVAKEEEKLKKLMMSRKVNHMTPSKY